MFLCIWRRVFVVHVYRTHFQAIFSFNKIFIKNIFNTILKFTGAYILLLENTKSK